MKKRTRSRFPGPIFFRSDLARLFDRSDSRVSQWIPEGKATPSVSRANGPASFFTEDDVLAICGRTGLPIRWERLRDER